MESPQTKRNNRKATNHQNREMSRAIFAAGRRWDCEADIIVVGAGNSGLPAAIVAAELGAKVVVLESMSYCASSLALVEVGPAFAGTDAQKEQDIEDSPELYYRDGVERAKGLPEMWRLFADHQLDTYNWCKSLGLKFGRLFAPPGHSAKRGFFIDADEWLRTLEQAARERGVDIRFLHRATRLVRDPYSGRIVGVKVKVHDKVYNFLARRAVVLATGGFGRNRELVVEYGPEYASCVPRMPEGHTGDGLKMALAEGAATQGIGIAVAPSFQIDEKTGTGNMSFVAYTGGIFVNVWGKRFWDESVRESFYGILSREALRQPGGAFWVVYDDRIKSRVIPAKLGQAQPVESDDIEDLALKAGIDPRGLAETVAAYNSDIEIFGYDTVFGRRTLVGVEGSPITIEVPPFYAIKCAVCTTSFKGGLKVNTRMQVMSHYGEPIPGLYACGEVAGGLWGYGGTYLPNTMISAALTFGRIAGVNAAMESPVRDSLT